MHSESRGFGGEETQVEFECNTVTLSDNIRLAYSSELSVVSTLYFLNCINRLLSGL